MTSKINEILACTLHSGVLWPSVMGFHKKSRKRSGTLLGGGAHSLARTVVRHRSNAASRMWILGLTCLLLAGLALCSPPAQAVTRAYHSADTNFDDHINLSELLRIIQFFNSGEYSCVAPESPATEDGYRPGPGDQSCDQHDSDYQDPPWKITLSELLRLIQMYNARAYGFDPTTEDGYRPIFDPEDPTGTVQGESEDVRRFLDGLPDEEVMPADKEELNNILLQAESAFVRDDICEAGDILDQALSLTQVLRATKVGGPETRGPEILFARIRNLQFRMLVSKGIPVPCRGREREAREPESEPWENTNERLVITTRFGAARFLPTVQILPDGSEELFTQLVLPGFDQESGEPGMPGVPCVRHLIAVPPGASVQLFEERTERAETRFVRLLPFVDQPVDQAPEDLPVPNAEFFANRPFRINEMIYATDRFYPPQPYNIVPLGMMRGLEVYLVELCAGQYNPVSEELRLFTEMQLRVEFRNGPEGFMEEFMTNPFESNQSLYTESLLNVEALREFPLIPDREKSLFTGEELIILTHPDFRNAAYRLADWKRQKGIMTNVFTCGTGSGIPGRQTAAEIDTFIERRYKTTSIRASYILIMGDAEFIPTHYVPRANPEDDGTIGSDYPYAVISAQVGINLPTFAIGRIPVDRLDQANNVVDKIIAYESDPPRGPGDIAFYRRIMMAAQFQCCRTDAFLTGTDQRTFIESSEFIRPALVARGYDVRRLYRRTIDNGCSTCTPRRPAYTRDATPRWYYDGTPLSAEIGPGSGFSWNSDSNDIISLFNLGVVLALHRDHGWPGGWATPRFDLDHIYQLYNGRRQPVVFSINCSSGVFDNETSGGAEGVLVGSAYWAERMLRQVDGGAIGIIGDTRVSPSWANSALARGLFDAIFPEVLPRVGGSTRHRRLGDILNHAKMYVVTQIFSTNIGFEAVRDMLHLYHVIGDPTLEIWTASPSRLILPSLRIQGVSERLIELTFEVSDLERAVLTLYQPSADAEDIPIGRGLVQADGSVLISPFRFWNPEEEVLFSLNREDIIAGDGSVRLLFN